MARATTDQLYGENAAQQKPFRFHCETIFSRSSLHRFEIGLHRHEGFLQILYISGGDGDATLKGAVRAIKPPAVIIVPPGFEHGFRFSRDIAGIILTIIPTALSTAAQTVARQYLTHPMLLSLQDDQSLGPIANACEVISAEHAGNRPAREAMMEGQITSLIASLCRLVQQSNFEGGVDRNGDRLDQLLSLITLHFREHQPAEFYASHLGLSQTHLNRFIRQKCGTSLQKLISRKQLDVAQQELLFTVSTVQMVSTSLGFSDPAYFSRFFVRETGMTPRAWRLAEQQKLSQANQTSILPSSD